MGTIAGIAAYIGLCAGVLTLFSFADKAASPEGKKRARALLDFRWKDTVTRWPSVFVEMFDSIFGKKHLTRKCFWRSCVASLAAVTICTLIFWWLRPDHTLSAANFQLQRYILAVLCIAAVVNFIPDYVSLLETRLVLRFLGRETASWTAICAALVADFLSTVVILALGFLGLALLGLWHSGEPLSTYDYGFLNAGASLVKAFKLTPLLDSDGTSFGTSAGIFLWSTYFTSVWLWLYALATFAGKLLLPILNRVEKFKKFLDLDNKPFLAFGWLSVVIITVLFAIGAVVKACV